MPIVQLMLRAGKQNVSIPSEISNSNVFVKDVSVHFNVEKHGFYQGKLYFNFLPANVSTNNMGISRSVIFPIDHVKSYSQNRSNYNLGQLNMPRNFSVDVDLDNGLQVVSTSDTVANGQFDFKPDEFDVENRLDYIQGGTEPTGEDVQPYSSVFTSVGLMGDGVTSRSGIWVDENGKLQGPIPFLYSLLVTLEYEGSLI